jgi:hypothetical protein
MRLEHVPETKTYCGRQPEATMWDLLARPTQRRFKSWPDERQSKSKRERETNIPGLLETLFSPPVTEDGDMSDVP